VLLKSSLDVVEPPITNPFIIGENDDHSYDDDTVLNSPRQVHEETSCSSFLQNPDVGSKRPKDVECSLPCKIKPTKTTTKQSRLPNPCPAPTMFSQKTMIAVQNNQLIGTKKIALLREASLYYYGYCQNPTSDEHSTMAMVLCEKYPQLKDKQYKAHDWVS